MRCRISTPCRRKAVWGLLTRNKRKSHPAGWLFQKFFLRRPPCGGIVPPDGGARLAPRSFRFRPHFVRGRSPFRGRAFSFSARRYRSGRVFVFVVALRAPLFTLPIPRDAHRCRSRCTRPRSRASRQRSSSTGTGSNCPRCCRAENHGPTSSLRQPPYP